MIRAITTYENHGAQYLSAAQIDHALGMYQSRQLAIGNSSTEVNIANLNINTKATDAVGVAKELPPALKHAMQASDANSGLN
jgi:hypothetical protein